MTTRQQIVDEARSWIGTPYVHQASLKLIGVDCIGLIRGVARCCGLEDPFACGKAREFEGYSQYPNPTLLTLACEEFMIRLKQSEATLADVLVFNFVDRGISQPQHFGIISKTDPNYIIHSLAGHKVVEHHLSQLWQSRVVSAYQLRGVS